MDIVKTFIKYLTINILLTHFLLTELVSMSRIKLEFQKLYSINTLSFILLNKHSNLEFLSNKRI